MPAELGLHRIRDLAGFNGERDLLKLRNHLALRELAEISTLLLGWACRLLLCELCELGCDILSRDLGKLSLKFLDLGLSAGGILGGLGGGVCKVLESLLNLGGVDRDLVLDFLLEKTLNHDHILESLLRLVLAERILCGELFKALGSAGIVRAFLDDLILLLLEIFGGHSVETLLLGFVKEKRLHEELLRELVLEHLLRLFHLLCRDLRLARFHERGNVLVELATGKRLSVHRKQTLILAAAGNTDRRQCRSTDNLDVHSLFSLVGTFSLENLSTNDTILENRGQSQCFWT